MLFEIDDSISQLIASDGFSSQDEQSLHNLLQSVAEGSHRITGSRSVLQAIAGLDTLRPRERAAATRALGRVAEERSLVRKLTVRGRVVSGASVLPVSYIEHGKRVIQFSHRWFDGMSRMQPTTVLGENLDDVKVLELMSRAAIHMVNISFMPLAHLAAHGGGSTIGQVLSDLANQQRICVCVVDSDKASPASELGDTASTVSNFKDNVRYPTIEVMETIGRDLENALPDSFYDAQYSSHSSYAGMSALLASLSTLGEHELRFHVDVKRGLKYWDFLPQSGVVEHSYWSAKQATLGAIVNVSGSASLCVQQQSCPETSKRHCDCAIVRGISANVLEAFIHASEWKDGRVLARELDDSVRGEWLRLGMAVASWCCADQKTRI